MAILRAETISGIGTNGPIFDGIVNFESPSYFVVPSGTTDQRNVGIATTLGALRFNSDSQKLEFYGQGQWWEMSSYTPDLNGGTRGVFTAGVLAPLVASNVIQYVTISSTGNALDFGDLITARWNTTTCSSSTRGVFAGGYTAPPATRYNIIEYITISSTGNTIDFGDLLTVRSAAFGCSSATRGIFAGGYGPAIDNVIQYITIASTGNSVDFGDLTVIRRNSAAFSSQTRGIFVSGVSTPSTVNTIDYITIATTGNATDFGDFVSDTLLGKSTAGSSNSIRGVFAAGYDGSALKSIDYVTIATTGNSTRFGDLTVSSRFNHGSCSSSTRALWGAGSIGPANTNSVEYVSIMSTGDALDFGDLPTAGEALYGLSNGHGGL